MIEWVSLSLKSLWSRKVTTLLTCVAITVSVALLLGIERVRLGARESFSSTVSQTDLIVGGRSGSIALLLYSVFHIGNATNNIDIKSFDFFRKHPAVNWTIPISLGDSHKGYRVIATTSAYFKNYRYGEARELNMKQGKWFEKLFEVVIGAEVAKTLKYKVGDQIVISHGQSEVSLTDHEDSPFVISGILDPTMTPVDRGVFISLQAMEAIHRGWEKGYPTSNSRQDQTQYDEGRLNPHQITAFYLGAKSRLDSLRLLREINDYQAEPLLAIMPALTLAELWTGLGYAESALQIVSLFVILATVMGLLISLYTTLNERRREMSVLRAVGASPSMIILMLIFESMILTLCGTLLGIFLTYSSFFILSPLISKWFGIFIPPVGLQARDFYYLLSLNLVGLLTGFLVGYRAYKNNLHDGLQVHF